MPVQKKHKTTSDRHNFMQFQVTRREEWESEYLTKPLYAMHIFHFPCNRQCKWHIFSPHHAFFSVGIRSSEMKKEERF